GVFYALLQASRYCQGRGVPVGAVCNGHQLVAFIGSRNDGEPPLDGYAYVFPSLPFMMQHFGELWNLLSRQGIENRNVFTRLLGASQPELPPKLSASLGHGYPGTKGRNPFQADLKIISEIVIEDVAGSDDLKSEFLKHCYCRSGLL